jgi:DNA damage-binding protein 1
MHQTEGGFLKPVIFGGLDGILTSFAIVAGAAGGSMPVPVVLVLGFSNIFADALAMGVGEFLSSKAENEWILSERRRESWEMENYPEGEIREMIDIYELRGMSREDATKVIETMAKYKEFFVDVMMTEELALQVPEENHKIAAAKEGLAMFCSFATFGSLPLIGYVVIPSLFPTLGEEILFTAACVVTGLVLFGMGCVKSMFRYVLCFLCVCSFIQCISLLIKVVRWVGMAYLQCFRVVHLRTRNTPPRWIVRHSCLFDWSICRWVNCKVMSLFRDVGHKSLTTIEDTTLDENGSTSAVVIHNGS